MSVQIEGSISIHELDQLVADEIARRHNVVGMAKGSICYTMINGKIINAYASLDVEMGQNDHNRR